MSRHDLSPLDPGAEPERYELDEAPPYRFEVDRRGFLKAAGAGLFVLLLLDDAQAQPPGESGGAGRRRGGGRGAQGIPREVGAWLRVGHDGRVTVFTGKAEVGQNIRTSLAQVVAEELRLPTSAVSLVMADTAQTPFDMGTFGSRTTPEMSARLRKVGAAARGQLVALASELWHLDPGSLKVADGAVVDATGQRRATFGELAKTKTLTSLLYESEIPTPPADWKVAGTSVAKVDGLAFVTGRHRYASDLSRPGMLHGKVLRAPNVGATLVSADLADAGAMDGVMAVQDGKFVGVVAPTEAAAARALRAIKAEWNDGPLPSDSELYEKLQAGRNGSPRGPVAEALAKAAVRRTATYRVAYIAHAPLEPRSAVAEWREGAVTVWTGTQRPFGVRDELCQAFGLPPEKVRVVVPDTGSGYGGKHTGEAAVEAARLAKLASKPVKLVWTREEEFTWAYLRPAGVIAVDAGVGPDGRIVAWDFHNYNSGGSSVRSPYDVALQSAEFHGAESPLRQGSYRALASTANHFAREVHMDDLAGAAKLDPLEFRRKNLRDDRIRAVLDAAAKAFGWGRPAPDGHGYGLACGADKGGFIATCAEVAVEKPGGKVRVVRAVSAFDCGAVVNPDHLRMQVEGCLIQGLGGALFEEIRYEKGRLTNPRFSRYRVPRFEDTPEVTVVLVDRRDQPPAGAGEIPIVAIAPAISNAIYAATGTRLRDMPLAPEGTVTLAGRE